MNWIHLRLCSQMLEPPHRLHWLLKRLCSQMFAPPHCLHLLFWRLCSQMLDQPHCLHLLLWRLCRHFAPPFFSVSSCPRPAHSLPTLCLPCQCCAGSIGQRTLLCSILPFSLALKPFLLIFGLFLPLVSVPPPSPRGPSSGASPHPVSHALQNQCVLCAS